MNDDIDEDESEDELEIARQGRLEEELGGPLRHAHEDFVQAALCSVDSWSDEADRDADPLPATRTADGALVQAATDYAFALARLRDVSTSAGRRAVMSIGLKFPQVAPTTGSE